MARCICPHMWEEGGRGMYDEHCPVGNHSMRARRVATIRQIARVSKVVRMAAEQPIVNQFLGRRLPDQAFEHVHRMEPGDYGRDHVTGIWWVRPPRGAMFPLKDHRIIEHDDKTISVEPVIVIEPIGAGDMPWSAGWRGHLEHGVWRDA